MKKKQMQLLKRYRFFLMMLGATLVLLAVNRDLGTRIYSMTFDSVFEMLGVLPPIFILLGLLDVWVKKETMVKYMGEGSGIVGVLLGFFLGAAAAGPLYAAFPVAGIFLKKGSRLANVFIIVGAWASMNKHYCCLKLRQWASNLPSYVW